MVRIGVIAAYPDEDWHSARVLLAALARSSAEVLSPLDFSADMGSTGTELLVQGRSHRSFDGFLTPRALGDEGDAELQIELYRTLAEEGALVVNDVRALTIAIDKWKTSWLLAKGGVPTPRALVVQRPSDVGPAIASLGGRAVAKPLYGSLGIGVELVDTVGRAVECLGRWKALYLQAFVPALGSRPSDLRAFVVGDRVVTTIARTAQPGEFRANVHLGGRAGEVRLDGATEALAVRAAKLLGLDYAGVDLIASREGPQVIEVNGTPLFRGIYDVTGRDMAEPIVDHLLDRIAARGSGAHRGRASGIARGGRRVEARATEADERRAAKWPRR